MKYHKFHRYCLPLKFVLSWTTIRSQSFSKSTVKSSHRKVKTKPTSNYENQLSKNGGNGKVRLSLPVIIIVPQVIVTIINNILNRNI